MLYADGCDGIPCGVTCETLLTIVSEVVQIGHDALCPDLVGDDCSQFTAYVTIGEPVHPWGEYLGGWIIDVSPYNPRNSQAGQLQVIPRALVQVGLKLMEQGWPMVGVPNADDIPSFEEVQAAAVQSMSHAERITRALYNACSLHSFTPSGCQFQGMGSMRPVPPGGGLAGWTWGVQLALTWQ